MSTEVQPSQTPAPINCPTPPPRSSSWHPSSLFAKPKRSKSPPPATLTTQGDRRHRRRSSSLGEAFAKLKPSNRPERGGTLRLRREDEQYVVKNLGAAGTDGRPFHVPGPTSLATDQQQHVHAALEAKTGHGGKGRDVGPRHDFEHPSLAGPSEYASWSLDRSQRERATASFPREGNPRVVLGRSAKGQAAFADTRYSGLGRRPAARGHAPGRAFIGPGRGFDTAHERLAARPEPFTRVGNGSLRPVRIPVDGGAHGPGEYTGGLGSGDGSRARKGERKERVLTITTETSRPRIETEETGPSEKPEHGSVRGNGLRKLLGSWGKKMNREELSGSPGIDRSKTPLPSLPIMAQEDLGFRISIPDFSEDKQITTAQQIFEDRKNRREQRRSLRESGDYLGVQGANPRTGYWDVSSGSEPSQMSEETKQKLDEKAQEVAERKRRYQEAEKKHQIELQRVQSARESKKKMEKKMKQRRRGKWQLSENGWSSVAEPDLSPIIQSAVGTPLAELSPGDRLFPMPTAADPAPYVDQIAIKEKDYFGHRPVSSPLKREHQSTAASSTHSIPRKPVGSPTRRQDNVSSLTTIHNPVISSPTHPEPASVSSDDHRIAHPDLGISISGGDSSPKPRMSPSTRSPSQRLESFLEKAAQMEELGDPQEKRASVISFQSVSTKQVQIHRPSDQNQRNPSRQARIITCLNELPPVILKDPFTASIPSNSLVKESFQVWMPPTIIKTEPDHPMSSINMFTTTTTGNDLGQRLPAQLDGQDTSEDRVRVPSPQHKMSRMTLRADSFQDNRQRQQQSKSRQTQTADTVTSSVHQLGQTKERTARLCQMASPGGEKVELKNTHISISTSLTPERDKQAARNAALVAFQHLRHTVAASKAERQGKDKLTPPKLRRQTGEAKKEANRAVPGVKGGTGSPSKSKQGIKKEPSPRRKKHDSGDRLIVHHPHPHPAPKAEKAEKAGLPKDTDKQSKDTDKKAVVLYQAGTSPVETAPKQARAQLSVSQVVLGMLQNAWLLVEPVFNPDSDIRKRFDTQSLTGQDIGLFVAAALFCTGLFMVLVILARVVGIGLQALRSFGLIFRLLIGV